MHLSFEDSRFEELEVSTAVNVLALVVRALTSVTRIVLAYVVYVRSPCVTLLFFNDTPPTDIYPLSLHDALPISYGSFLDAAISKRPFGDQRYAIYLNVIRNF